MKTFLQVSGTMGWLAPEIMGTEEGKESKRTELTDKPPNKLTKAVDIFSLGCVFHFVLTKGQHPFGPELLRQSNILSGSYDLSALKDPLTADLIKSMLSFEPEKRSLFSSELFVFFVLYQCDS